MIPAYGGELIISFSPDKKSYANTLPKIIVDKQYINDCEMIGTGAFSPVNGFMNKKEALSVINNMRLPSGELWSIPILLPVKNHQLSIGEEVAICESNNKPVAIMLINEIFSLDLSLYAQQVFRTNSLDHPGVKTIFNDGSVFAAGKIVLVDRPKREQDINLKYYKDPIHVRDEIASRGWNSIVAFQTRNPIHRAHEYIMKVAL